MGLALVVVIVGAFAFMFREQKPQRLYQVDTRTAVQTDLKPRTNLSSTKKTTPSIRERARSTSRLSPREPELPTPRFSLETRGVSKATSEEQTQRQRSEESAFASSAQRSRAVVQEVQPPRRASEKRASAKSSRSKARRSKVASRRRAPKKTRTRRTQNSAKFTDKDYRLLMHRVRSARDTNKKRAALKTALTRLRSSDKYYREVKSLLDSL